MKNDRFDVLERFTPLVDAPMPSLERLLRRRDRIRRRQRIAAGIVGFAVFVVVVVLFAGSGRVGHAPTPGGSGIPHSTAPAIPLPDERVGFVGLPPGNATPSTPRVGDVVLQASGRGSACGPRMGYFCWVWVYADGRLIWIADQDLPYGANERTSGLLEQRLTKGGVERLVSEFISTGACSPPGDPGPIDCVGNPVFLPFPAITKPGWTDPAWGLPASSWEDPEIRAFVPSRFAACATQEIIVSASSTTWNDVEPSGALAMLPSAPADLLRGKDVELPNWWDDATMTCFALTNEEAGTVKERLDSAGVDQLEWYEPYGLAYQLMGTDRFPDPVLWIGPILPHGEWVLTGGG